MGYPFQLGDTLLSAILINPDQTGFIKGRYIGQNIRLINDILEQTKLRNIPGIVSQLDFRKAFDTIEWEFIQKNHCAI